MMTFVGQKPVFESVNVVCVRVAQAVSVSEGSSNSCAGMSACVGSNSLVGMSA